MQGRMGVALVAVVAAVFAVGCAGKQKNMAQAEHKHEMAEAKRQQKAEQEQARAEQKHQQAEAKRMAAEDKRRREDDKRMAEQVRKDHQKYEREQREAFASDIIRDERKPRALDHFAQSQAAAGASDDLMLNDAHFTGGELNALGRSKVALIARAAPAGSTAPVVIYYAGDDKAAQPRVAAVQSYWRAMPYGDLALQVKGGMNDTHMTPASVGLKGLTKMEKTNYAGSSGTSSGGGTSSGTTAAPAAP